MRVLTIILGLLALNSCGFLLMRVVQKPEAKLKILHQPHHKYMVYLIGGSFEDFRFLESEFTDGIALVQYDQHGLDLEEIADHILTDIVMSGYHAKIYTISGGDKVGRLIDTLNPMDNVEIFAINPCPSPDLMWPEVKTRLKLILCLLELACFVLGFGSTIPVFTRNDSRYSFSLARDLLKHLLKDNTRDSRKGSTKGVLISSLDKLTNPKRVVSYFQGVPVAFVRAGHAESLMQPQSYLHAYNDLQFKIK